MSKRPKATDILDAASKASDPLSVEVKAKPAAKAATQSRPKSATVYLTEADHIRLKVLCAQQGLKANDILRDALDAWMQSNGHKPLEPMK